MDSVTSGEQATAPPWCPIRTLIPASENRLSRAVRPTVSGYACFEPRLRASLAGTSDRDEGSLLRGFTTSVVNPKPFCGATSMSSLPVFVGLDFHQDLIRACILDADGRKLVNRSVGNDAAEVARVSMPGTRDV